MNQRMLSLHGLRGFEAAARLGSLTEAAKQLNLTQSAISRQVKTLEDELGFALFVRRARTIELTAVGREFLRHVQKAINNLDQATDLLRRSQDPLHIRLSTFASFASLWLIPRLGNFRQHAPFVNLDIGATDRLVDLDTDDVDIAIRYASASTLPPDAIPLIDEVLFPVVSRSYLASAPQLTSMQDLAKHTLIDLANITGPAERRASWDAFTQDTGYPEIRGSSYIKYDFVAQTSQAALRGQGVALSFSYGADAVLEGDLISPLPVRVATGAGCYLLIAQHARKRAAVLQFVEWITQESARFREQLSTWLEKRPELGRAHQTRH
jgi:LysR family transcriptional regulator, glycine cleavage system transcriptional activator